MIKIEYVAMIIFSLVDTEHQDRGQAIKLMSL